MNSFFTIPKRTDQGGLGILHEGGAHFLQPGLELLTVFDELGDQVDIAIDPFAAVRALAQAAVIGLEDMQVQRGEERELVFRNARVQLRLRPVQIGLNLAFQLLEDGQVIGMNAYAWKAPSCRRPHTHDPCSNPHRILLRSSPE